MAYPRGEWGVRTPHFSKSWTSRFARKNNKIFGGGSWADLSRRGLWDPGKASRLVFQGFAARFWFLRNAWTLLEEAFLVKVEYLSSKIFLGSYPQTHSFQYLLLYLSLKMPLAIGIPVCCLGWNNLIKMISRICTITCMKWYKWQQQFLLLELLSKNEAIDWLDNY